jgi:hypothetical protein
VFGYSSLANSYFFLDRFDEAESALQRASARKLETPDFLVILYNIAVLKGNRKQMDQEVDLARGKLRAEHWIAHQEALALARSGRLQAARRSSNRAMDLALQAGERETAAAYQAARAVWEALYGDAAEGKRDAMAALDLSKGRDVQYAASLAFAFSGDSARSQPLADDLEKRSLETHRNPLILRYEFFGRRLQCGTGLPACQQLTCVAPGSAIQVSPPNERRRPSAQVASRKTPSPSSPTCRFFAR